jgi:hypothetical protein
MKTMRFIFLNTRATTEVRHQCGQPGLVSYREVRLGISAESNGRGDWERG